MVVAVLPIVIGAMAAGLVAVYSIQGSVSNRLSDSADAQVVSANFVQDVQSAQELTTDALLPSQQCGSGTQLLGIEWNPNNATPPVYQSVITYAKVKSGPIWLLERKYCNAGFSATPSSITVVSQGISPTQAPPTIGPNAVVNGLAQNGWIPVGQSQITSVIFQITEPASNYNFTLTGIPATAGPLGSAGSPIVAATNTQCGFAPTQGGTVNNGTYAAHLCLVDFSGYNAAQATSGSCQPIVASIPNTGDTLSFCLNVVTTQPIVASALPTYPEAFLGNTINGQPFYTGIGCPDSTPPVDGLGNPTPSCSKPALYQTNTYNGPTSTITVTNIRVTTATGGLATGWQFVSADAETTDIGESITWTADKPLSLLPNTPSSPYGDTCDNSPNWVGPHYNGGDQIVCASGQNETAATKTGTPMVEALQPTTMTVYMKGTGLEGVALGLLLS